VEKEVTRVTLEPRVPQGLKDLEEKPDHQDHLVPLDLKDKKEIKDKLDNQVHVVKLANKDSLEKKDIKATLASLDQQDLQAPLVLGENRVK
jgi:hypothetical protein